MRKLFLVLIAVLLIAGMGYTSEIFVNPQDGPMITIIPVYNNDTITLGTGSVVIWDFGSSTGDDDNYVVSTTTADTFAVAGVVYPAAIPSGKTGSIAVYGIVDVDTSSAYVSAGANLCTSTTAGQAKACTTAAGQVGQFGYAINAQTGSDSDKAFIKTR